VISLATARELLDFAGGGNGVATRISRAQALGQLEGAVAIHNILERDGVAYLADEVGMGKTYVALGAIALFRHFNPSFRLLVIAPKENIQQKWTKELRNFVRNNVRFADLRVKAVHQAPARPAVLCDNLLALVRETALDPDRDFFARLSSFSLGLTDDVASWRKKREDLLRALPWLHEDLFTLHSKDAFKENFARAVCCALPVFDLVVIDEGHNLKGGISSKAWRNRLLALAMGREPDGISTPREFRHYGPRAKRLLLLSATPLEDDYRHVWNQLSVFGLEAAAAGLEDGQRDDAEKKRILSRLLIRRVNEVLAGDERLTKNQYRREWRSGGVDIHDEPLNTPGDQQQLVVALVQKKVSELLAHERFNHSFQIGMLASFESFLQTAKVRGPDEATFDDAEQTDDLLEREGIDVNAVNRLATSYWKTFGRELPHPKMDSLVQTLRGVFATGDKALVFVRRVASVKELKQKLDTEYDDWLHTRLRGAVRPELQRRLEAVFTQYAQERRTAKPQRSATEINHSPSDLELDDLSEPAHPEEQDRGGTETFFAWFFRGEGPPKVLSGAAFASRLNTPRYALSSYFLDNWVAGLLEVEPGQVLAALRQSLGMADVQLRNELEHIAGSVVPVRARNTHRELFLAFQYAALSLLAKNNNPLGQKAATILHELFDDRALDARSLPLGDWLETPTFFTELRRRPTLREELWPTEARKLFVATLRRSELRRELISSMCRLGHPLIDLWLLYVNHLGRLDIRAAERAENVAATLTSAFLDELERQRGRPGFTAWKELYEAAQNFDLIVDTNVPSLWERRLAEAPTELGKLLREQQPIGGMSGAVNRTLVRQFRMPGYPLALITTDLLQEGEDLHLFCSRVYHYGISWMPSSMEQRTGRIDRVQSQTERRLTRLEIQPTGDQLLQVFYPYLRETVEVFQVERVFERLNRFMRLMHERFGSSEDGKDRTIDLRFEAQRGARDIAPVKDILRSSFPVLPELTKGAKRPLAVSRRTETEALKRFQKLLDLAERLPITWEPQQSANAIVGALSGPRQQSFTLLLHSIEGVLTVRCVSPVGRVDPRADTERIASEARPLRVRIGAVYDPRFKRYDLTAESDVILGDPASDGARVRWLIETVASAADRLEEILLEIDNDPALFNEDLAREAEFER
jgi:hypothetical protein